MSKDLWRPITSKTIYLGTARLSDHVINCSVIYCSAKYANFHDADGIRSYSWLSKADEIEPFIIEIVKLAVWQQQNLGWFQALYKICVVTHHDY